VQGVAFQFFEARDVVRHPLVQRIVLAYEGDEELRGPPGGRAGGPTGGEPR
jgi:phosphate starvation-inducible PhoH-like protein